MALTPVFSISSFLWLPVDRCVVLCCALFSLVFPFCQTIWLMVGAPTATTPLLFSSPHGRSRPSSQGDRNVPLWRSAHLDWNTDETSGYLRLQRRRRTRYTHLTHNSRSTLCLLPTPTCCLGQGGRRLFHMRWNSCFLLCVSKTTKQQQQQQRRRQQGTQSLLLL